MAFTMSPSSSSSMNALIGFTFKNSVQKRFVRSGKMRLCRTSDANVKLDLTSTIGPSLAVSGPRRYS